ncbi:MAG: DUF6893 family small protein [Candidatus Dormibacteria bacterium]
MKQIIALVVVAAVVAGLASLVGPDLKRYMRIRSM